MDPKIMQDLQEQCERIYEGEEKADLHLLNNAAFAAAQGVAQASLSAGLLEHHNPVLLAKLRDEIMERDGLKASPAEVKARETAAYVEHKDRQVVLRAFAETMKGFARYFNNRIAIMLQEAARV